MMLKHVAVLTAFLAFSAEAASILVDNLNQPTLPGNTTLVHIGEWAAQSFITDGSAYDLANIATVLGEASGNPSIVAELRRDTPAGSLLTTLSVPSLAGPLSAKILTLNAPVALDANTTYWLILGVSGAGSFGWSYAEGNKIRRTR